MGSTKLSILAIAGLATLASGDLIAFDDYRDPRGLVDSVEAIHTARSAATASMEGPFLSDPFAGMALGPLAHPAPLPELDSGSDPEQDRGEPSLFTPRLNDLWTGVLVRTTAMVF